MSNREALVLFAHGARDPAWTLPLTRLANLIEARAAGLTVRTAFLELQQPSLGAIIDELAATHRSVVVLPVFWAAAGHVQQSLPALLADAQTRHPDLHLSRLPVLSELPGLLEHIANAAIVVAGADASTRR